MKDEFNLSEKMQETKDKDTIYEKEYACFKGCVFDDLTEDVKEFIRRLKEMWKSKVYADIFNPLIDKLAGEKLKC